MRAKEKKILATVITVLSLGVILGLYFIMPFGAEGVPQIVDRAKMPDGTEVILTQVSTGAFKPYEVSLFVHRPNGTWTPFLLAEQTIHFRGQVLWNSQRKVMEVLHYGAVLGYYDPAKNQVFFADGRPPRGPLTIVVNPLAKQVLSDRRATLAVSVARPGAPPRQAGPPKPSPDAGPARDAEPAAEPARDDGSAPEGTPASAAPASPPPSTRAKRGKWSATECRIMEADVDSQQRTATQCSSDADCCLVWDEVIADCLAANRTADLHAYRDGIRALARNCGGNPRRCQGVEPACLFGQCEARETGEAAAGPAGKLGRRACPQAYVPSVKTLRMGSPEVTLLTDPGRDPAFDPGAGPSPVFEVCVSAEGHVTSARPRKGGGDEAWAPGLAKIEATWRFQPHVEAGQARPFCTEVSFPLTAKK